MLSIVIKSSISFLMEITIFYLDIYIYMYYFIPKVLALGFNKKSKNY